MLPQGDAGIYLGRFDRAELPPLCSLMPDSGMGARGLGCGYGLTLRLRIAGVRDIGGWPMAGWLDAMRVWVFFIAHDGADLFLGGGGLADVRG